MNPATRPPPTEHQEQCAFVDWWRWTYPGVRIFAIPNGGLRNKVVAVNLRKEGVDPGVPDLHVPAWSLWIEMKRQKGQKPKPAQQDWHEYLRGCGDTVLVAYGCDDAIGQVKAFASERGKN